MSAEMTKKTSRLLQYVSFVLNEETFAVDVMKVRGVERIIETTSIPGMPDFLEGVINLRDVIIPIVDLRKRFSMDAKEPDKETRIILVELDRGLRVGMVVDHVREVFQVDPAMLGDVPRIGRPQMDTRFIRGVAKKDGLLIIVLDIEKIFSEEEAEELKLIT